MTEAEWLACEDPESMVRDCLVRLPGNRASHDWHLPDSRQLDLFCVACCRVIWHLLIDEGSKRAMEWMEANAGRRDSGDLDEQLEEHGQNIKDASECEENHGVQAMAARIAEDIWCNDLEMPLYWFCRGFDAEYPGSIPQNTPAYLADVLRDIFRNPFRSVSFSPSWRTGTAVSLARTMYESRDFSAMAILADALQDAGCDDVTILDHCRGAGPHVRGCWVVDLVLGKE